MIIIVQISMLSIVLLYHVRLRLIEIFGCSDNQSFPGLSAISVRDLYQLPPTRWKPLYGEYNNCLQNSELLWKHFEINELAEVMQQQGNSQLVYLLNQVGIGNLDENKIELLASKSVNSNGGNYPKKALIFMQKMNQ